MPPAPYGSVPPQGQNTMAVVSLIFGIAGFVVVGIIGSIVALITGNSAKKQIAQTGQPGLGLAKAGVILGWIGVGLTIVGVIALIILVVVLGYSFPST